MTALTGQDREALSDLALLYGTFLVGRWAEVMADDTEPPDDWQEQAAREAVDLFAPGAAEFVDQIRAQAWDEGVVAAHGSDLTLFAIKQVNPYRADRIAGDA